MIKKINRDIIEKAIKDNAFVQVSPRKKARLQVSPEFIDEYIDRIFIGIEINIRQIAERVHKTGRKTLTVKYNNKKDEPIFDDVTMHFSFKDSATIA